MRQSGEFNAYPNIHEDAHSLTTVLGFTKSIGLWQWLEHSLTNK